MSSRDKVDICNDVVGEPGDVPQETAHAPVAEPAAQPFWARRTFLKAAALGTAAAALVSKSSSGLRLGPLPAAADDLSTFQCTANDVRIIGLGQVLNEPCGCSGTFSAQVQFTVENNAASARGCITLHLVQVTLPGGSTFGPVDVILNNGNPIPGKTTQMVTGTITNYPCGAGLICFGSATADGRRRCDAGECSTVSWAVPGQETCPPDKQISSKCRHQQICIQGRGKATLTCAGGTCATDCGTTKTLTLCTTSPTDFGPFSFSLPGGTKSGNPTQNGTCQDFTVGPIITDTTFTGTVTDKDNCATSASVKVTSTPISVSLSGQAIANDCGGKVKFTATTGGTGCTFVFKVDGTTQQSSSSNEYTFDPIALGSVGKSAGSVVTVDVDCGGCKANTCKTVTSCVSSTVGSCASATAESRAAGARKKRRKRSAPKRGTARQKGKGRQRQT